MKIKMISDKRAWKGKLFEARNIEYEINGHRSVHERILRPPSVAVIAFTDPKHIILLHEFRLSHIRRLWRLPGGRIDKEHTIQLKSAAQRELQEEAGFRARSLKLIASRTLGHSIQSPAHIFVGKNLIASKLPHDRDEDIHVHVVSFERAYRMALSGLIGEEFMALTIIRLWHKLTKR